LHWELIHVLAKHPHRSSINAQKNEERGEFNFLFFAALKVRVKKLFFSSFDKGTERAEVSLGMTQK
jgi:hypothetical protein